MPNGDGSPSDEQFHLSESCKEIIDLYNNSDLSKEDQEDNFWNKLKEFTRHANEAKNKTRYNIAELVQKLNNYKTTIESLKSEVEVAKDGALPYLHLKETILRDYSQSILIIGQLQEKSLNVEKSKEDMPNGGNGNSDLSTLVKDLKEYRQKVIMNKMSIKKLFENIADPFFNFLSMPNNEKEIGEININALNLLLINFSTKLREYDDALGIGNNPQADILLKESLVVLKRLIDKLDEICRK
jgi:hypothetical protein